MEKYQVSNTVDGNFPGNFRNNNYSEYLPLLGMEV